MRHIYSQLTVRHHGALSLLGRIGVPDAQASVAMTANELFPLVMPTGRLQRLTTDHLQKILQRYIQESCTRNIQRRLFQKQVSAQKILLISDRSS